MFLQNEQTGVLVKILDTTELINPLSDKISVKVQSGEEEQDPEEMAKAELKFPSGEELPRCWLDAEYQQTL